MNNSSKQEIKVLFSQVHKEQLSIDKAQFSVLRQMLTDQGYALDCETETLTPNQLAGTQVLVLGAPSGDLKQEETEAIRDFVQAGGGLLLVSSAETMIHPQSALGRQMTEMAGMQFQKFLNYPITFLQVFRPHYVTANVGRVKVGKVASLNVHDRAHPLAFTKATRQTIMACANIERGRVMAIGDVSWLADDWLLEENNAKLAVNTFRWLAARNVIDVECVVIPETVEWGQTAEVMLHLRNSDVEARPQVECTLESDADAVISEPAPKSRSIPPGRTTRMRWTVRPQILGDQELRLIVRIDGQAMLFFDQLSEMRCLAPGFFTLKIEDKEGKLKTDFETGDHFTVEGVFHWTTEVVEPLSCQLELQFGDGLVEWGREEGNHVSRWHLQAISSGAHKLTLRLTETGQLLPALVTVSPSYQDRLIEIQAAFVYPLEAEIAARLRRVDESLSHTQIRRQCFRILPPEEFVQEVYKGETAQWLQGVLAAARREQWYNPELLDLVLAYIAPTYLPNHGSFIPYDPGLASSLARLHPVDSKFLEYNLLCSKESDEINLKQNVAAFLLHEKFGHGFFYTQTRLGQQLAILQRHGFPDDPDAMHTEYKEVTKLIEDSTIVVNEGFAAWVELTFLGKLDREVRQAVYPRRMSLIQQAKGLYRRERDSLFFQAFPPRFDSRYREGFEYLDFISQRLDPRCAVRAFLIATNIDLGIAEDLQGQLHFKLGPAEIQRLLLEPENPGWRSDHRLRRMADWLYEHDDEADELARNHCCLTDCHRSNCCPLEALILEELQWRVS